MGVYAVLVSDSNIIKAADSYKSILILGCTSCANVSIAYEKGQPVYQVSVDDSTGKPKLSPYSITKEAERIKGLLEEKGSKVKLDFMSTLCWASTDRKLSKLMGDPGWADPDFADRYSGAEAVIALSCSDGVLGLKSRLGEDVKIIPVMKTVGTSLVYLTLDESGEFIRVDPEKSLFTRKTRR